MATILLNWNPSRFWTNLIFSCSGEAILESVESVIILYSDLCKVVIWLFKAHSLEVRTLASFSRMHYFCAALLQMVNISTCIFCFCGTGVSTLPPSPPSLSARTRSRRRTTWRRSCSWPAPGSWASSSLPCSSVTSRKAGGVKGGVRKKKYFYYIYGKL